MRANTEWAASETPGALGTATAALRAEVWRYLPAWLFFFYACLLLNCELTNLSPPRPDLAWTAVFPISVFLSFYAVRAARAPDVRRRVALFCGVLALAVCLPLLNYAFHRPFPIPLPQLRLVYEWSNFVFAGLLVAHAWSVHRSHVALFFGAGLLYGAMLENGGILLGFFHELHLSSTRVEPLVAPVATMIGWSVVLYMASFTVWQLRAWVPRLGRSAALSALLVGAFATLIDLQIDPAATATGCWVWHESLPVAFCGVPLLNFVAWMCALCPFAYVMFRWQERRGLSDSAPWPAVDVLKLAALSPVILTLAALAFIGSTLVLEGRDGPSWTLLNAFTVKLASWVFGG